MSFWEEREQVERFAAREPDLRLVSLVAEYRDPARVRVLDLGCAAGRNTVFLATKGFDVAAVDASRAMAEATRLRLADILGEAEAAVRVRVGRMDRLDWLPDGSVDLLAALGIYHCAQSGEEWNEALAESSRVLKRGGRLLASVFTPETDLTGEGVRSVEGQPHVYDGYPGGRAFLVDSATLDFELARHGLFPLLPAETVTREVSAGRRRVSANGLYEKR